MISQVSIVNLRGWSRQVDLTQHTLVLGQNGSGKSSLLIGMQLALLGYVPGMGQRPEDIYEFATGPAMTATVRVDGKLISRTWTKNAKGSVSEIVMVDGVSVKRNGADALIHMALNKVVPVVDVGRFWTLSDRLQLMHVLQIDNPDSGRLLDAEKSAREEVSAIRDRASGAEESLISLSAQLSAMPSASDNIAQLDKDILDVDTLLRDLRGKIAESESTARIRKDLTTLVASLPDAEAKHKAAITKEKDAVKALLSSQKLLDAAQTTLVSGSVNEGLVHGPAADVIRSCVGRLEGFSHIDVQTSVSELRGLLPDTEAILKRASCRDALAEAKANVSSLERSRGDAARSVAAAGMALKRCQDAEKRLAQLPVSAEKVDVAAVDGLESRLVELRSKRDASIRRQQVVRAVESARLTSDKAKAELEDAKAAIATALKAIEDAVHGAKDRFESAGSFLPDGRLDFTVVDGAMRLAWVRDGIELTRANMGGAERVIFDAAVGSALAPKATIMIDAGEVSDDSLMEVMDSVTKRGDSAQVMLVRWVNKSGNPHLSVSDMWSVVNL